MTDVTARFTRSGALASLLADELSLLLYPSTELEAGPCQLWLRRRDAGGVHPHPLTGPASGSIAQDGAVRGRFGELAYTAWFATAGARYAWQWEVRNLGDAPVEADVVFTQDVALTTWENLRRNEYYVSQYLDLTPVETAHGTALAVRQNLPGSGSPWLGLASLTGTAGWVTDALQVRRPGGGLDLSADLPGTRWQHEHTLAGLQTPAVTLAPGEAASGGFVGVFVPEHPAATGPSDAPVIEDAVGAAWPGPPEPRGEAAVPVRGEAAVPVRGEAAVPTVMSPTLPLLVRPGTQAEAEALAGAPLSLVETGPGGEFFSAFAGDGHVVGAAKELAVLRPHGHVMHFGPSAGADAGNTASTAWMAGVFCSQLTRGHASGAPAVSLRRSYAGLVEAGGVRIAVRVAGRWRLLGVPSLWWQRPLECVWRYLGEGPEVTVRAHIVADGVRLEVRCQPACDVLVAVGQDSTPVELRPDFGDDAVLFSDGISRGLPWRCLVAEGTSSLTVDLRTAAQPTSVDDPWAQGLPEASFAWRLPRLTSPAPGVAEVNATVPWFAHDAAVHFQAPRGLEQFTGGAWGTRDVCQGPVGLLVASGEHEALRSTLCSVFAAQQDDGDWPQWFDYLPGVGGPGYRDSHGDIVYWPLLALGEYLLLTGDASILDEEVRFVGAGAFLPPRSVRAHVARAVGRLSSQRTRDPRLPAYGHGDWNDSLQPAQPELARELCSAWTSVLEIEALRTLAKGLRATQAAPALRERDDALAASLTRIVEGTTEALREVLIADGALAGYALVGDEIELFVHPRDTTTGLAHGSLQLIHAIGAELLTPEEAHAHVALIDAHLDSPNGILLFDRPIRYAGGVLRTFLRAEAASFWGREIGLMYTHAHIRWIEALTHLGDADRAWSALLAIVPTGMDQRVPGTRPRQGSCYYSSADAAFPDRYAAIERAADLFDPATPVEGGWRVYSSGPGLVLRVVTERLLGIRFRAAGVEVDPVLPSGLDGLVAAVPVPGDGFAEVTYRVGPAGCGVRRVLVDGAEVAGEPLVARYRSPGVRVAPGVIRAGSRVEVEVG